MLIRLARSLQGPRTACQQRGSTLDRKSTRLNSSHSQISYAVFCLKKKLYHQGNGRRITCEQAERVDLNGGYYPGFLALESQPLYLPGRACNADGAHALRRADYWQ